MSAVPSVSPSSPPERPVNIVIFTAAQATSLSGTWMQTTTVGWLSWAMTHSAAWVGAIAVTQVIAAVVVGPLTGTVVDRHSPYRVIVTTQTLLATNAVVLFLLASHDALTIWSLLGMAMLDAIVGAMNMPVQTKIIALIAGRERLPQAIAANSIAVNLARSTGPAIAGVLLIRNHAALVFGLNAISYLAYLGTAFYLRRWTDRMPAHHVRRFFADVAAGFRYAAEKREIALLLMLAVTFAALARPFIDLLPAFSGQVFKGGPETLSTLLSAQGVGSLVAAVFLLRRKDTGRLVRRTFVAAIAMPLLLVVFCTNTYLPLGVGIIALAGAAHVTCNVGMQSMAQLFADDEFRGRVMALYGLLFRAVPSLGAFVIGLVAQQLGLRALLGGAAAIAVVLILRLRIAAKTVYASSLNPVADPH